MKAAIVCRKILLQYVSQYVVKHLTTFDFVCSIECLFFIAQPDFYLHTGVHLTFTENLHQDF